MNDLIPPPINEALSQLQLPKDDSHKGQNGKLLIIGGSELFHAASKWSLDIASKFVDMVFYSSIPTNNELIKDAKKNFWNGIVISREELENYIVEADCILIGPGMTRSDETAELTNSLLKKYPDKKWVIDAGALQMVEPSLLNEHHIITPHRQEFFSLYRRRARQLLQKSDDESFMIHLDGETYEYSHQYTQQIIDNPEFSLWFEDDLHYFLDHLDELDSTQSQNSIEIPSHDHLSHLIQSSKALSGATFILKGRIDLVFNFNQGYDKALFTQIKGGNAGMTKGGTGDVLAGLVAAFYCKNSAWTAAVAASYFNKKAGDYLYQTVGPFFNSSDLVDAVPQVVWQYFQTKK